MKPMFVDARQRAILASVFPRVEVYRAASALRHAHAGRRGPFSDREISLVHSRAKKAGFDVGRLVPTSQESAGR